MAITTGFNAEKNKSTIQGVISAYNKVIMQTYYNFDSKFVDQLAKSWASKSAVDFYSAVKTDVDQLNSSIAKQYKNIVDVLNDVSSKWAKTTGDVSAYSNITFDPAVKVLKDGVLKENINGDRGVDDAGCAQAIASLKTILQEAKSALNETKRAVADSGYIGGSQQSSLTASIEGIKTILETSYEKIINAANKAIGDTKDAYGTFAGKVSDAFSGKE